MTSPCSGWRQRSRASRPITALAVGRDLRLIVELELALPRTPRQRSASIALRRHSSASMSASKKQQLPRPSLLARRSARSACLSRSSALAPSRGISTTPMLALRIRLWPSISNGAARASISRRQSASAPAGWSRPLLHDRELVAADAGEQCRPPRDAGQQALGAGLDHPVAERVAERVVELAEAVEVEAQQRRLLAAVAGAGQRLLDPLEQAGAVGEVGQRVVGRQMPGLRLARAPLPVTSMPVPRKPSSPPDAVVHRDRR